MCVREGGESRAHTTAAQRRKKRGSARLECGRWMESVYHKRRRGRSGLCLPLHHQRVCSEKLLCGCDSEPKQQINEWRLTRENLRSCAPLFRALGRFRSRGHSLEVWRRNSSCVLRRLGRQAGDSASKFPPSVAIKNMAFAKGITSRLNGLGRVSRPHCRCIHFDQKPEFPNHLGVTGSVA